MVDIFLFINNIRETLMLKQVAREKNDESKKPRKTDLLNMSVILDQKEECKKESFYY